MKSINEPVKRSTTLKIHQGYALRLAVLVLLTAVGAQAQAPGANRGLSSGDGNHVIQGRVFFPSGQAGAGKTIKIHLESVSSASNQSTVTDPDGAFRFNNVSPGSYRVIADAGKEYEAPAESISIDPRGTSGLVTAVTIQLKLKVDAANPAFSDVPQAALGFYAKGTAAAQKGDAKQAADFFSKAVAAYPNFTIALNELGLQYLKLRQWDKAAETYQALLKQKPTDAVGNLNAGIAFYNLGIASAAEKKPEESQQQLAQAESHLRAALNLKSPGPSAHYYLGVTLIRLRKYDEAQKELELAISNGGENLAMAHRYLGGLYQVAHKNKEAADELEKFLKLDPKAADADTIRGMIEKLRKP